MAGETVRLKRLLRVRVARRTAEGEGAGVSTVPGRAARRRGPTARGGCCAPRPQRCHRRMHPLEPHCTRPPAALIISELVGNVVDHAHTIMTVEISLQPSCLYLAVRDGGGASPALHHIDGASDARGRGLQPVAAFSSDWCYIADETARPCGQHCPCLVPRRPALRQGRNPVQRHVDGHRPDDGVPTRPGRWQRRYSETPAVAMNGPDRRGCWSNGGISGGASRYAGRCRCCGCRTSPGPG